MTSLTRFWNMGWGGSEYFLKLVKKSQMLERLNVKHFKNIRNLENQHLARVNLITGKNNVGKSTVLEALIIWASKANLEWINRLLRERDELYFFDNDFDKTDPRDRRNNIDGVKSLSSFFCNKSFEEGTDIIQIGDEANFVSLQMIKYVDREIKKQDVQNEDRIILTRERVKVPLQSVDEKAEWGLEVAIGQENVIHPLSRVFSIPPVFRIQTSSIQFVKSNMAAGGEAENVALWENITLTEKEDFVIQGMQIIEPRLERLAFVKNDFGRAGKVLGKLKNSNERFPLKSMGDGINRVMQIIMNLVNAQNGYLMIDEFENGLHYSVQEKLWEVVFSLAEKLNVQVFATTHSRDCIEAFAQVVNQDHFLGQGKLIRLENEDGVIREVSFDNIDLKIAKDNDIELR